MQERVQLAKSDVQNLWNQLKKYDAAALLFARVSDVAFSNNRAERHLMISQVKQQVSGCFRTELYARAYYRISSYLQRMKNRGRNLLWQSKSLWLMGS